MMPFNVINQVVHYWLAETLCCCELTQHKVILFIVLLLPFQICKVTVHQSPAAANLALFSLSFSFPKGDCLTDLGSFVVQDIFFSAFLIIRHLSYFL